MFIMCKQTNKLYLMLLIAVSCIALISSSALAQRDDDDDFDDAGFDNAGYSPNAQDDASSNQSPTGSASSVSDVDDIDDDDDVDETQFSPQVAQDSADDNQQQAEPQQYQQQQQQQQQVQMDMQRPELSMAQQASYAMQQNQHNQQPEDRYYPNVAPQRFYAPPNSVLLANVDPSGRDYHQQAQQHHHQHSPYRYRRSTDDESNRIKRRDPERDVEDALDTQQQEQQSLIRHKRHSKYIGPVYTYVKTDKHARYKWGVKHKVGKHHG